MKGTSFQWGREIEQYRTSNRQGPGLLVWQWGPPLRAVLAAFLCLTFGVSPALSAETGKLNYKVDFTGIPKDDFKDKLEQVSKLTGKDRAKVESVAALRRTAENDIPRLATVLRSEGYYTPRIDYELTERDNVYRVTFAIRSGLKFRITDYVVTYLDEVAAKRPATLKQAGLKPDGSPKGEAIAGLQKGFLAYLHQNGFPAARIADRRVEAVPATGTATLRLTVESGPPAVYGPVEWKGLERTKEDYVNRFVPWKKGQKFDLKKLTTFRDQLAATGLFTTVDVQPGATGPAGVTPVKVKVTERPPRTIGVGASYSTNVGPGGQAFWEHRNIFGRAEKLRLEANIAQIKQQGVISFRKPLARKRGSWFTTIQGGHDDNDAFSGYTATGRTGYERKLGKHLTVSAAVEGEWSAIKDSFGKHRNTLGALPLRAVYDTTNDILNPTKGFKIAALVTPQSGSADGATFYTTFDLRGSGQVPFDKKAYYVAAMWGHAGATVGAPIEDIPANRRFYAGGSGSVRGYGYQLLSPLDANLKPIGGRSVLEGGVEFRVKFTKSIGMVTFVEAGSAFASGLPNFNKDIRVGAGAGFRYYTAIGPVRLDFAVPLERRKKVDDAFQIYVSLGQAF